MAKLRDLTGQRFTRLVVIERAENANCGRSMWRCRCDCGNEVCVIGQNLVRGRSRSCGCWFEDRKHMESHTRLYRIWTGMKTRCGNPKHHEYYNYGGKGISVCDEWKDSFQAFHEWATESGYADGLTIDRIDNEKNYCPENCRWATYKQQANNRTQNHLVTYNGKTQNIAQWAEELGINRVTLQARINRYGWDIEKAMTTKDARKKNDTF